MFSHLKISGKLLLLLGALLTAMLLVGGYATYSLIEQQQRADHAMERERQLGAALVAADAAAVTFKLQVQEWKDILLRGHEARDYENYVAAYGKRLSAVQEKLDQLEQAMGALGLPTQAVAELRQLHRALDQEYQQALKQFDAASVESSHTVDRLVRGKDRPLDEKLRAVSAKLSEVAEHERATLSTDSAIASRHGIGLMMVVMAAALAAGLGLGVWVARGITRPLGEAVRAARRVADGDLTVQLQSASRDEVGELLDALSTMAGNLRALATEVASGARAVADTSGQIAQGNLDLSQRTEEQASTLEETASQMEELTTTVARNADNARQASQQAAAAADVARRGGAAVGSVVATMDGISGASRRIADIIGVIDGIAFQTNILALNAAVEAARAGEQGRGFAVVAAEVRSLAQRSAAAAREVKELISDSSGKVEAGSRQVADAGRTMDDIVASVGKVSELVAEIAAASAEQSAGIEQVNSAVVQMEQVVQQNASLVEEASAATEAMKAQAAELLGQLGRFKLNADAAPAAAVRGMRRPLLPGVVAA